MVPQRTVEIIARVETAFEVVRELQQHYVTCATYQLGVEQNA